MVGVSPAASREGVCGRAAQSDIPQAVFTPRDVDVLVVIIGVPHRARGPGWVALSAAPFLPAVLPVTPPCGRRPAPGAGATPCSSHRCGRLHCGDQRLLRAAAAPVPGGQDPGVPSPRGGRRGAAGGLGLGVQATCASLWREWARVSSPKTMLLHSCTHGSRCTELVVFILQRI